MPKHYKEMMDEIINKMDESKVEDKSDEKLGLKEDVTVEETKEYKTFRDKYNA